MIFNCLISKKMIYNIDAAKRGIDGVCTFEVYSHGRFKNPRREPIDAKPEGLAALTDTKEEADERYPV